jgi:hypothetical protein
LFSKTAGTYLLYAWIFFLVLVASAQFSAQSQLASIADPGKN